MNAIIARAKEDAKNKNAKCPYPANTPAANLWVVQHQLAHMEAKK